MAFIEVTVVTVRSGGPSEGVSEPQKLMINADHIITVQPGNFNTSVIHNVIGGRFNVLETYDEMKKNAQQTSQHFPSRWPMNVRSLMARRQACRLAAGSATYRRQNSSRTASTLATLT